MSTILVEFEFVFLRLRTALYVIYLDFCLVFYPCELHIKVITVRQALFDDRVNSYQ